jgi:hypothetical protein
MAEEFASAVRPTLEPLLEQGETLRGVVAATYQKTFSGSLYAIGVTDGRLLLQPLDRKLQPKEPPLSLTPEAIAEFQLDGAGEGWWTAPEAILDASSLTLKLRTNDGEKLKLMMMRGGGTLMGGESQKDGVTALGAWLAAARRE